MRPFRNHSSADLSSRLLQSAVEVIRKGGIVAYPVESCYGLGCDPRNHDAVERIIKLKKRCRHKGVVIIASTPKQLLQYTDDIPEHVLASWPGAYTWLLPANQNVPANIHGKHTTVAVRITAHPLAAALCTLANSAIVSTSANRAGQVPVTNYREMMRRFGDSVDLVLPGKVGSRTLPSTITDATTRQVIRAG